MKVLCLGGPKDGEFIEDVGDFAWALVPRVHDIPFRSAAKFRYRREEISVALPQHARELRYVYVAEGTPAFYDPAQVMPALWAHLLRFWDARA